MNDSQSQFAIALLSTAVLAFSTGACDRPAEQPLPSGVAQFVHDQAPADIQHRVLIDFEGKVQLIGYELEPEGKLQAGRKVALRLYWRSLQRLPQDASGSSWVPFAEVLDARGWSLHGQSDRGGPLRDTWPPSKWEPGKVYVDEHTITMPRVVRTPEVAIAVGFRQSWEYPVHGTPSASASANPPPAPSAPPPTVERDMRLRVISGPSDGLGRGLLSRHPTGYVPPARSAEPAQAPRGIRAVPLPREGRPRGTPTPK